MTSRRNFLLGTLAAPLAFGADESLAKYLETNAKSDGGYGWVDEPDSALTPTFATVGCYRLLKREPPRKAALVRYIRNYHFPWPPGRKTDRPMHRFDYEQVQALLWLGEDVANHRADAQKWNGPSDFTKNYEMGGNPILKQEVGALNARKLLGITDATPEWRNYLAARRRSNGSFNTTPSADGSDGHVANTLWGLIGLASLGIAIDNKPETVEWLRSCQLPNGGFTYAPKPELGGVDQVYYTWAAVEALRMVGSEPRDKAACIRYLQSLRNADGGCSDRPGYRSNPVATYQALAALTALGAQPAVSARPAKSDPPPPPGLRVFTMQFEAPGKGSPSDAVEMARALRIHMWGAKNAEPGWIEAAQKLAADRKVPVTFFPANEEYGTYVSVPGLGTYSHLSDIFAAPGTDFGKNLAKEKQPIPWKNFRDERIAALKRARGGNTWQFNENEEITRVLLDEAVEKRTFEAVSSYHFGNENFVHTQPFLNPYRFLLPTIGLQDAHSQEPWWWGDFLTGFRTLYLAKDASWDGWLEALKNKWLVAVRHDSVTDNQRRFTGGTNAVRAYMLKREQDWVWQGRRPWASVQTVRPADQFETVRPGEGEMVRVRLWRNNANMGLPKEAVVEMVSLSVDGKSVQAGEIVKKNDKGAVTDVYYQHVVSSPAKGRHRAVATVRMIDSGKQATVAAEWMTL